MLTDNLQQVLDENSWAKISLKNKKAFLNALAFIPVPIFKGKMWASERDRSFHRGDSWSSEKQSLASNPGLNLGQITQVFWVSVTLSVKWGYDTYTRVISMTLAIPPRAHLWEKKGSINHYAQTTDVSWDHSRQTGEWSLRGASIRRRERVWPQCCHLGGTQH